ncbi:amidohydrolase [Sporichthya polymorpha]|uniref:amidohydrolase n=1 Tax=Sporichthya polymorpha TaxID=35751 RepID=UPI0003668296
MSVRLDPRITHGMRNVRRDLHAHPELSGAEFRTTALVADRLAAAGLAPKVLPGGTGLVCDLAPAGAAAGERAVTVLRADLDALPLPDVKDVPYRSTVPDTCHACGHDLHTAVLLGAGLVLAEELAAGALLRPVRLVFQPAEEAMWGARAAIEAGALDGVGRAVALHADPRLDVGRVGLRAGAITGAADFVLVRLTGPGGHTARPHLTADLVHALGVVATQTPALLARRFDPRAGLRLVWGRVAAGSAANAIPAAGELAGTVRCLDTATWDAAPDLLTGIVTALAEQHGVTAEVEVTRGVPPCVNDADVVADLESVLAAELGADAVLATEQSLGGEDFAWFTRAVPGALVRLGTRGPGAPATDLHTSTFDVDEGALEVGIRTLVAVATAPPGSGATA